MHERVLNFGPANGLLGVLTTPSEDRPADTAVILLNAGLLHHVGPNRLHVDLARRLADQGYSALRFDLSGIGDSELPDSGILDIERSRQDVIHAMDALSNLGIRRYVLMGLCTGAYNAFRAALGDDRVVGCVLIDGYAYPTVRSRVIHYRERIFELDRWIGYLKRLFLGAPAETRTDDLIVFENEVVPKERFERELGSLLDRQVALLLVYTGLGPLIFNYPRQMHDAFPDLDLNSLVRVVYYPDADHTFRLPGNRRRLMDDVETWMASALSSTELTAGGDR